MHMRKTFRMFLALALVMLGVTNVSAGDRIPVDAEHFTFHNYDGWGADAVATDVATGENGNFLLDQADGCPIGDTNCNAWIDLGAYSKLYVKMAGCDEAGNPNDSNPRIFINRTAENGQFNADKSAAQCLVIPNAGTWAEDYYTVEDDGTYVINLTKIAKEWGFVHFHSIKGSAWNTKAIVNSIEVEKAAASQQIGWVNLINNSDMEGDDVSSFFTKIDRGEPMPSEIADGVGVDGSRGIVVAATAKVADNWDNQFWFRFNEPVPVGTKYKVSFDYKADAVAEAETQAHAEPSKYIYWSMFGNLTFDENWKTFELDGEVTADQAEGKDDAGNPLFFQSVAFNLNAYAEANNYYFDNIKFEVYKYGTTAEFSNDVVLVDFGFDTNLPDLVKASGKTRLMFPLDCAKVKVNGEDAELYSVEGFADGRFYIFLENAVSEEDEVLVSFTNPTDEAYRIIYTSGSVGSAAGSFVDVLATLNSEIEDNDGYPYDYLTPVLVKADPENGSFNLPTGINTFKLTFDKNVDCAALQATVNGKAMTVTPNTDFATEVTLTCDALADGEYTVTITKIYPEMRLADEVFGEETITVSVGKVVDDPNDQPYDVIPASYFSNCGAGGIPEGYYVKFGEEDRPAGTTYGSGSRMFDFAEGGDFTKGLYFREGYVEYGSTENYALTLEAGKKYVIHFNTAMWKGTGNTTFDILTAEGETVQSQTIENKPDVNGSQGAVNGSTITDINFIPEADGNYLLRWTSDGFVEILLANVSMKYMPNTTGIEYVQLLTIALENAKSTLAANTGDRYAGEAYDALDAAIKKYDAEKDGYTAPSAYEEAAAALDAAAQAMKDHRALCDDYDTQIKKALDVERQNKENKFANTELYAELQTLVAKYHGSSEWVDASERDEAGEIVGDTIWQLNYTYDVLKEDAALKAAVAELADIANTTSLLFTEGKSTPDNSNNGKGTGVAVLVERIRLGAEALKTLGVNEKDELIVAANNALTDDDSVADAIKNRITEIIYGELKDPNNELFKVTPDENTLEDTTPEYDMTVFVKNPNVYKQLPNTTYSEENIPGWIVPEGFNAPGLTTGWNAAKNVEGVAEDCMFQTWGSAYRVEQTIVDLPAGVYTIQMGFGERNSDEEAAFADSYIYAQTTDNEEPVQEDVVGIGQAFPFTNMSIKNLVVTDGILTIGANAGPSSHTFFNDVRLWLTAPAEVDYASLYNEFVTGVEAPVQSATVKAVELYTLDGRRISTARQGIVIVKKVMSDGTVRTEKVVKK